MILKNRKIKRLKGKTKFDELFLSSAVFKTRLLSLRLIQNDNILHLEVGIVVSKKFFTRAVDRNKIKRLLREAIKKNEKGLSFNGYCIFIYNGSQLPVLSALEKEIKLLIRQV